MYVVRGYCRMWIIPAAVVMQLQRPARITSEPIVIVLPRWYVHKAGKPSLGQEEELPPLSVVDALPVAEAEGPKPLAAEPLEAPDTPLVAEPWDPASLGDGMQVEEAMVPPMPCLQDRCQYPATQMVPFMQLHRHLRDPSKAANVMKICARWLLPPEQAEEIVQEVDSRKRRVPDRTTVARNFIRSDLILMLWYRSQVNREDKRIARFLTIDSSPQASHDYFIVIETVMERDVMEPVTRGNPLGGFQWRKHMLPVTCLGAKDHSTVHIVNKMMHAACLGSGEFLLLWRQQVKGFLSDQGTERKVASAPVLSSDDGAVRAANIDEID